MRTTTACISSRWSRSRSSAAARSTHAPAPTTWAAPRRTSISRRSMPPPSSTTSCRTSKIPALWPPRASPPRNSKPRRRPPSSGRQTSSTLVCTAPPRDQAGTPASRPAATRSCWTSIHGCLKTPPTSASVPPPAPHCRGRTIKTSTG